MAQIAVGFVVAYSAITLYKLKNYYEQRTLSNKFCALSLLLLTLSFAFSLTVFCFDPEEFWEFYLLGLLSFYPGLVFAIYDFASRRIDKRRFKNVILEKVNEKRKAKIEHLKEFKTAAEKMEKTNLSLDRVENALQRRGVQAVSTALNSSIQYDY